jgi:hypothetical protein
MTDWQLMQTAPKTGETIVVACPDYREVQAGNRVDVRWDFYTIYWKSGFWGGEWCGFSGTRRPTHWRPVTEIPPSQENSKSA